MPLNFIFHPVYIVSPMSILRCTINLCNQLSDGKLEQVLHLDIRFKGSEIVRNTTIGGNWGPEETFGGLGGLSSDSHFECVILIHTDCYKVSALKIKNLSYKVQNNLKITLK